MTGEWFDSVVAALARAGTRRVWLAALAIAVTGIALGDVTPARAGQLTAAPPCRGKRTQCKRNGQCCSGRCRKRRGKNGKKTGKCRCSLHTEPCRKDGDCCLEAGMPQVCVDGNCAL